MRVCAQQGCPELVEGFTCVEHQGSGCDAEGPRATSPFIVLCGFSGVGKSTVREVVAKRFRCTSFGVDDFADRWVELYYKLDVTERAVVECVRMPRALRRKADERGAFIIELTANKETRRRRLEHRGESTDVINARLAETGSIGYEDEVRPFASIDTSDLDPDEVGQRACAALAATGMAL